MDEKKILDVTCGPRSIWFNKHHPAAVYRAKQIEMLCELGISECRRTLENWLNAERTENE